MDASDMKEMRKIIDNINVLNDEWFDTFHTDEGQTSIHDTLEHEIISANKILSKPPRNCDVGTAEEQEVRFMRFCESHWDLNKPDSECAGCPLDERVGTNCEFAWAQMPYEAQEGVKE